MRDEPLILALVIPEYQVLCRGPWPIFRFVQDSCSFLAVVLQTYIWVIYCITLVYVSALDQYLAAVIPMFLHYNLKISVVFPQAVLYYFFSTALIVLDHPIPPHIYSLDCKFCDSTQLEDLLFVSSDSQPT